ncbi:unnamed protein product [Leptosia nina]|uniref:Progestin and adipoQ receptor family member 4 n=1 Tax=Leptosia nina TaxID=320188 RepID=A0AAV1J3C1_9NEOP
MNSLITDEQRSAGVSLVFMIAVLPWLLPWGKGGGWAWFLSLCHLLGALAPWCGSFLYHLFMNHTRGASLYHRLLQLDMLGIWVSQSIGAIPMVTATVYCAPTPLRYSALVVYCLGSLLGLYKAMRAWSPWERRLCFAAPFCMRLLLAGARAARFGGGDPHAILHVFLQGVPDAVLRTRAYNCTSLRPILIVKSAEYPLSSRPSRRLPAFFANLACGLAPASHQRVSPDAKPLGLRGRDSGSGRARRQDSKMKKTSDSTPGVPAPRSASGRAGSRRDPARAVETPKPAPRPRPRSGEALYDTGIHRTLSDPGLSRPRPCVRAPPATPQTSAAAAAAIAAAANAAASTAAAASATTATVAAEIAATPFPNSLLDSVESHFLALSQGSPETLDAMFRSLSGDVPPAPRGSPRALLYSDAIAYAIVRKQVAFSDGLHAAVRAYLDRVETELRAEGLLSTPLTQDESAVAHGNIARSTPLRRPRPESPSSPDRDSKRPCQDAAFPSLPEPLSQRDPRLRRRLALPVSEPAASAATAARASRDAPPAPAARTTLAAPASRDPSAAPTPRAAPAASALRAAPAATTAPAATIAATAAPGAQAIAAPAAQAIAAPSFAQIAAAPTVGRPPTPPPQQQQQPQTKTATPRYPPLDAVSLGGGVIGALHIPEKWFPGSVDRCLNSHNIMHVLVVLAVYSMHQITHLLILHDSRSDDKRFSMDVAGGLPFPYAPSLTAAYPSPIRLPVPIITQIPIRTEFRLIVETASSYKRNSVNSPREGTDCDG